MAVANTKSPTISALDTPPRQLVDSFKHRSPLHISMDALIVSASDDAGSVYRMVRLPSNASIFALNVLNSAITDGTDFDLGIFQMEEFGGAAVDANAFANALSMVTRRSLPLNALFQSTLDGTNLTRKLWQWAGEAEDPQREYDIAFLGNTPGSIAGTLSLQCVWSQ